MYFVLVLKEALDNKGVTNEVKSRLRAEVFSILEDNTFEKPRVSQENLLINELIREYMDFNHYKYSKSVFLKGNNHLVKAIDQLVSVIDSTFLFDLIESNQPSTPLNREIMATELHIKEDKLTRQVPLIYSLLWNSLNEEPCPEFEAVPGRASNFDAKQANNKSNSQASKNINIYKYNPDHCDPDHKI